MRPRGRRRSARTDAIVVDSRGRYALATVDEAVRIAHALSGVLCLTSAALHHGWAVREVPDKPHVLVPKKRKVSAARRAQVHLHRGDIHADDIAGIATGIELTLTQCLRHLPTRTPWRSPTPLSAPACRGDARARGSERPGPGQS